MKTLNKLLISFILLSSSIVNSACVNPQQGVTFTDPLLSRKCSWLDITEAQRAANTQQTTVFFGDSLIQYGVFNANYGISGDTTSLLLNRTDIVINAHPTDVYILVGINDFYRFSVPSQVYHRYISIINKLKEANINVHVISTIKCTPSIRPVAMCTQVNIWATALNTELARIANIDFIDANAVLSDSIGLLPQYTTDGVHLNAAGYAVLYNLLGV